MKSLGDAICWVLALIMLVLAAAIYRHSQLMTLFALAGMVLVLPPTGRSLAAKTGFGGRFKQVFVGLAIGLLGGPIAAGIAGGFTTKSADQAAAIAGQNDEQKLAQAEAKKLEDKAAMEAREAKWVEEQAELLARREANAKPPPVKQDLSRVVYSITKDDYPKTYKKWGKAGADRINNLMLPAAKLVADSPRCSSIDYMGLSDDRSTKKNIVFFVDCVGTERFYVDEAQIKSKQLAMSENQMAERVSDTSLLQTCKDQIRARLNFPSTFDPGWFGTSVYRAPAGRTVATIDFEAKNALGASLPHRGKCFMEGNQVTAVEIAPR